MRRVTLIIGNAKYANASALANLINDATDVCNAGNLRFSDRLGEARSRMPSEALAKEAAPLVPSTP